MISIKRGGAQNLIPVMLCYSSGFKINMSSHIGFWDESFREDTMN